MKRLGLLVVTCLALLLSCEEPPTPIAAVPQWRVQYVPDIRNLLAISIASDKVGYVVGSEGRLHKTTNDGLSWLKEPSFTENYLRCIHFFDETHGLVAGFRGEIFKTSNGVKWETVASPTQKHLLAMHFINEDIGMMAGAQGVILKTIDGGETWIEQNSTVDVELLSISMINTQQAVAVGFNGTIVRTDDGGQHWTKVPSPDESHDLQGVHFYGSTGIAVGPRGFIMRSTNSGKNWSIIRNELMGTLKNLFAVQFADANKVFAAGTGNILVSNDAGVTWNKATFMTFGNDIYSLSFKNGKGWGAGQSALVVRAEKLFE